MPSSGSKRLKNCFSESSDSEVQRHSGVGSNNNVLTEPVEMVPPRITNPPYTSLESMQFGIRLLELAPGAFEDTIRLRIIIIDLHDGGDPTYEALSYVWGVDFASTEVYMDDVSMKVTSNLDSALRHFRRRLFSRILWIDALSINQQDVQERNKQVRNMGLIYQQATSVLIWLGQVDNNDSHLRAMLGAMQFSFSGEQPRIDLFDYICSIIAVIDLDVVGSLNPRDRAFEVLYELVSRPWFRRLWVVQELALSKSASIQIGTYLFPWAAFEQFVRWLPHYKVDHKKHRKLVEAADQVMKVPPVESFQSQLHRTLHLSTTDPRDKIYGILGISAFDTSNIEPDYNKSAGKVYSEVMALLLSQGKISTYWYAPLRYSKGNRNLDKLPDLPSWVPDFCINEFRSRISSTIQSTDELIERCHLVSSSMDESVKLKLTGEQMRTPIKKVHWCLRKPTTESWRPRVLPVTSMDLTTLFTTGSTAKTVVWTSGLSLAHLGTAKTTSDVQELIQRLYSNATRIMDVNPSIFVNALLRSIHGAEIGYLLKEYTGVAKELVSSTYRSNNIPSRLRGRVDDLATAIKANAAHRMLLITDDSRIGLSYVPSPEMGICRHDIVAQLFRSPCCSLNFILRPIDDSYHEMINVVSMLHTEGKSCANPYFNYYDYHDERDKSYYGPYDIGQSLSSTCHQVVLADQSHAETCNNSKRSTDNMAPSYMPSSSVVMGYSYTPSPRHASSHMRSGFVCFLQLRCS
jgi:hypothetical protein